MRQGARVQRSKGSRVLRCGARVPRSKGSKVLGSKVLGATVLMLFALIAHPRTLAPSHLSTLEPLHPWTLAPSHRLVSLVPAVTEMLFAIGAGDDVVGVSSYDR